MSLNKIIAEVTDANEADGIINRQAAISDAVPQILADDEMTEMCVRGHVSKLIATNVKSRRKAIANADCRQASMFGLSETYNLGDDEGNLKRTEVLSRVEFEQLIVIRQNQVNADLAHLTKLRQALRETAGIWDANPAWVWGDVEAEYTRRQRAAA